MAGGNGVTQIELMAGRYSHNLETHSPRVLSAEEGYENSEQVNLIHSELSYEVSEKTLMEAYRFLNGQQTFVRTDFNNTHYDFGGYVQFKGGSVFFGCSPEENKVVIIEEGIKFSRDEEGIKFSRDEEEHERIKKGLTKILEGRR